MVRERPNRSNGLFQANGPLCMLISKSMGAAAKKMNIVKFIYLVYHCAISLNMLFYPDCHLPLSNCKPIWD
jgi:hypothetical protein